MIKKVLRDNLRSILIISFVGGVILTCLSLIFIHRELAETTEGRYDKVEATQLGFATETYRGWPEMVILEAPNLHKATSFLDAIHYSPYYMLYSLAVLVSLIPNLLFWSLVGFVFGLIFYTLKSQKTSP